jgi:hypothetical protein
MSLRNKFILLYILVGLLPIFSYSQILTNTFVDPCTKKVTTFVVPLQGTTIVFMGKSKYFTSADVASGALMAWINQVYAEYAAPCPVAQVATQVTTQTVASAVAASVAAVPPPPPPAPAPAPAAQSGGSSSSSSSQSEGSSTKSEGGSSKSEESSSKSESKEESKSESKEESKEEKKEDKKEEKKEEKKKGGNKAAMTPIVFSSDLSSVQVINGDFNLMANLGLSRSSLAGDVSYGATAIIWSNLKQFALSSRYSKMQFKDNQLCGISTYSYTTAYNDGSFTHIGAYSYVTMVKSYILGYNLAVIGMRLPAETGKQIFTMSSVTLFGMRAVQINKRITIIPEFFLMGSPLSYGMGSRDLNVNKQISYIFGNTFDLALTKKFRISANLKYMGGPSKTIGLLVGSRFNL